ncbi:dachshund homolog 2-like, partial [Boleophthalmus pectinirostris]|uniref:dachshund homolog 2-like n=1 Tax=Boleophthalmus pectinirostris TaxID=150288 RepID=UPI00242EC9B7
MARCLSAAVGRSRSRFLSSRPGRPPKRCSGAGLQDGPRLIHPGLPGLLSPNLLSHTDLVRVEEGSGSLALVTVQDPVECPSQRRTQDGRRCLTAAAMAELQKLQKMKMMMSLQNGNESDNEDLHSNTGGSECSWEKERLTSPGAPSLSGTPGGGGQGAGPTPGGGGATAAGGGRGTAVAPVNQQQIQQQQQLLANRLELPFMMMPHPLLPMGLPPASVAMAMSQMNHLSTFANMAAAAQQIHTHVHREPVIKERVCDSPSLSPSGDENTPLESQPSSSASSSPERLGKTTKLSVQVFESSSDLSRALFKPCTRFCTRLRPQAHVPPGSNIMKSVLLDLVSTHEDKYVQRTLGCSGLELPFMMMPHPLLPMGLPPASVAMAMSQMNHLSTFANMAAAAQQIHTHVHREPVIKERVCDSPSLSPSGDENTPLESQPSSSASSSPERLGLGSTDTDVPLPNPTVPIKKITKDKEELSLGQTLPPGFPAPFLFADGLSSVETLLTNIQGLLKVAVENARAQDKQIQAEKRELKMELFREREMRESLERQLTSELQSR